MPPAKRNTAMKHFIIAAKIGYKRSLDAVKQGFTKGTVAKDEYANTLHAYQKVIDVMKTDERDNAAASGMFRN